MSDSAAHSPPATPVPWIAEVAAAIAHDLANSLTAFTIATHAWRDRPDSRPLPSELDELGSTAAGAAVLVRLLSRLSARAATPAVRLDLRDVVSDAAPLLKRLAHGRLRLALPAAPILLFAARSDLERALVELVIAARDRADAVRLAVECPASGDVRLSVEALAEPAPALSLEALSHADALAVACGGSLRAPRAGRIELSLPASR